MRQVLVMPLEQKKLPAWLAEAVMILSINIIFFPPCLLFLHSRRQHVLLLPHCIPVWRLGHLCRSCARVLDGSGLVSSANFLHSVPNSTAYLCKSDSDSLGEYIYPLWLSHIWPLLFGFQALFLSFFFFNATHSPKCYK